MLIMACIPDPRFLDHEKNEEYVIIKDLERKLVISQFALRIGNELKKYTQHERAIIHAKVKRILGCDNDTTS